MRVLIVCILSLFNVNVAIAQSAVLYEYDGNFDDATFSVEGAIVGKGLIIDHVSHTGEMLSRTAVDVGSDKEIFKAADIFLFCSAVISRTVMEADPMNIVHCPYTIFVIEDQSGVYIGHRTYPEGPMQIVQGLLISLVNDALEF
ncbi:MAG: DUF302 domain-containing protein [Amylibacter sp.]|nr:DUF302 domain-containing protein [Amylibacter sp.]|tara:strand:+ start:1283 stop:1714 length:432 start_codon:yes stop_codon:yes gene_type:complete